MRRSFRLTCTTSGGEDSTAHGVSGRICVRFVRRPIRVAGCARRASTVGGSSTADYVRSIRSRVTAARPGRERTASASCRTSSHVSVPARPAASATSAPKTTVAGVCLRLAGVRTRACLAQYLWRVRPVELRAARRADFGGDPPAHYGRRAAVMRDGFLKSACQLGGGESACTPDTVPRRL